MKPTRQKENTHTHTQSKKPQGLSACRHQADENSAENSGQRGNELERRGNIGQRGAREGGCGRGERALGAPGCREDGGRAGEAGLPVPPAAADFREGRKSTVGLGLG